MRLWKQYDLAVSTQSGDRPTIFALAAGRTHVGLITPDGPKVGGAIKRRALHRSTPSIGKIHRVEQMLRLADALAIERVPELVCPAAGAPTQIAPGENYAVIHAAPKFRYKQWTREGWRTLAAGLEQRGLPIVAICGPHETERKYLDDVWQGIATVRQLTWPGNVSLLSQARVYIGTDTSVTHLAAATGCPTVALFGPTDPRVWGPWPVGGLQTPWAATGTIQHRGNVWLVQNPLPCLPCTLEGCERHIESRSRCLDELLPQQVLIAVDHALANSSPPRVDPTPLVQEYGPKVATPPAVYPKISWRRSGQITPSRETQSCAWRSSFRSILPLGPQGVSLPRHHRTRPVAPPLPERIRMAAPRA